MKNIVYISLAFILTLILFFYSSIQVVGLSTILEHSSKVKPYSPIFKTGALLRAKHPSPDTLVFFLGDSSVAQPPWADSRSPHISAILETMLADSFPEHETVSVIEWSFAGGRPFHYYCLLFEAEKYSPSLLVIPINWRILGPASEHWNRKFAFSELCASVPISERIQPAGKSVLELECISAQQQAAHTFSRPLLYIMGMKIWMQTKLGIQGEEEIRANFPLIRPDAGELISGFSDGRLFQQYPNYVKANNVQLKVLRAIAETSARRGINLLFYITPIHMHEMRKRACFDAEQFRKSIELVTKSVNSDSSRCLDLSGLLNEDDFIDYFEHYTPEGNRKIAHALSSELQVFVESSHAQASSLTSLTMRQGAR